MKLYFIFIFCLFTIFGTAQNCNCKVVFDSIKTTIENNYAGYFDKVNSKTNNEYEIWNASFAKNISEIVTDSLCFNEIKKWTSFYKDKHIQIKFKKSSKTTNSGQAISQPIEILRSTLTENDFKKSISKDIFEGIWENETYKIGIKKINSAVYHGVVLTSKNSNWKVGEVKLIITKKGTDYTGTYFDGDKYGNSQNKVIVIDNILDFETAFFEKIFPAPKVKRNIREYEIQQDKQAPKLIFKNDLAVFTFPNFYGDSYEQLAFLLNQNKSKLEKMTYWIIDLRDNDGGDVAVGKQLLPYIYVKPIISYNAKMRITKSNIKIWFDSYVKEYYENLNEKSKNSIDDELKNLLDNHLNELYDDKPIADTIKFESKFNFPKKIGLIINKGTVSSGELFTLLARQSDKVTVYGENTAGMMDYGNLLTYKTPCDKIKLTIPCNRMNWFEEGFSVDKAGIIPEVLIDADKQNLIENIYLELKKQKP